MYTPNPNGGLKYIPNNRSLYIEPTVDAKTADHNNMQKNRVVEKAKKRLTKKKTLAMQRRARRKK